MNSTLTLTGPILLVEDDADTERLVCRALRKAGIEQVSICRDGLEALRMVDMLESVPALVLLDAKLPGVDGFVVLKHIRKSAIAKDSPVVVFSSEDAPEAIARAQAEGADEYAVKPTNYEDLMQTIKRIVLHYLPISPN